MIAVVVLNWNGVTDTMACLESLALSTAELTPVVVDNGSTDGSVATLRARFPDVDLLALDDNYGYAGGNNRGLEWALEQGFDHVAVLNNDTLVDPGAMAELLAAVGEDPVALSPRILFADGSGDWYRGASASEPLGLPVHDQAPPPPAAPTWPTEFLTGCCVFASADVWRRVGGFDESYFLIFEDSEWSCRAQAAGVHLAVAPAAVVHHHVSASFQRADGVGLYYFTRNALRFGWTHSPRRRAGVWHLVLRPGLRDLRREGRSAVRPALIRLVALAHAVRSVGGRADGWALRRLGLSR